MLVSPRSALTARLSLVIRLLANRDRLGAEAAVVGPVGSARALLGRGVLAAKVDVLVESKT